MGARKWTKARWTFTALLAVSVLLGLGQVGWAQSEDAGQIPYVATGTERTTATAATSTFCAGVEDLLICTSEGRPVDVVFVFDTTGSMGSEISGMKTAVINFANTLAGAGVDARFGLTEYKDFSKSCSGVTCGGSSDFPYKVYGSGNLVNAATLKTWIDGLRASGGADGPESLLAALAHTVNDQNFRAGAQKFAVVITDAPPHDDGHCCNVEGNTLGGVIAKLNRAGIIAHVIGPNNASVKKIAADTKGLWFQIRATGVDFKSIIDSIASSIACTFNITPKATCVDSSVRIDVTLFGRGGQILRPGLVGTDGSVKATVCGTSGACNDGELGPSPSDPNMWTGTIALPDAGGSYEVTVSAIVCGFSASNKLTVRCKDGGGVTDCEDCPDSDGDGVIDPWDACPATPECWAVDPNGCPVCEIPSGIQLVLPEEGQTLSTTLTLRAVACPAPDAVRFEVEWIKDPFTGETAKIGAVDNNPADGWGFANIPLSSLVLGPNKARCIAIGGPLDGAMDEHTFWINTLD